MRSSPFAMNFDIEKYQSIGGIVKNGTPKFHVTRHDLLAKCHDKESPVSRILSDRVMCRHIKEGNASDSLLKRDAEILQTNDHEKKKMKRREFRLNRIKSKRETYKRRYHAEPI